MAGPYDGETGETGDRETAGRKEQVDSGGRWLRDEWGRRLLFRGINLSGSSKLPASPDGAVSGRDAFYAFPEASFVGRPFPAGEADEHFGRLKRLGLTLVRMLVTWEAVEGAAPGTYREDYLDYLLQILDCAQHHRLSVIIDPHQDAWSRWTGGDGAPAWTLERVGFDLRTLHETGAAFLHQEHEGPYPPMLWPTNRYKLGAATLFTLFFGGDAFAPGWQVEGEPVQAFLQGHYLRAMTHVARRIGHHPAVIGFGSMNEPTPGWIGRRDLQSTGEEQTRIGPGPTPMQSLALGDGHPQRVATWELGPFGFRRTGSRRLNVRRVRAWRNGSPCRWSEQGLWEMKRGRPVALRPSHFARLDHRTVHFSRDFLRPFLHAYAAAIRSAAPGAILFFEGIPGGERPVWDRSLESVVHSPHWYDGLTLLSKTYRRWLAADWETARPIVGAARVRRSIAAQLARQAWASTDPGKPIPTLISEFGLPFDLRRKRAYRTGDYSAHVQALASYYEGLDANLLSAALWNYTPDNVNARGDGWNEEDLSIFSRDQQRNPTDPDSGLRALEGFCRPYPRATAGDPVEFHYDWRTRRLAYRYQPDRSIAAPTEIVLPEPVYPRRPVVQVDGGTAEWNPGLLEVTADPGAGRVHVQCRYTTP